MSVSVLRACETLKLVVVAAAAAAFVAGCGTPVNRAPVEDRGTFAGTGVPATVVPAESEHRGPPGWENAGKPGYYTVKAGDTLIRIGLENGQSWKDLARWNNLENANLIEIGQVLRVVPPASPQAVAGDTGVVTRPIAPPTVAPEGAAPKPGASAAAGTPLPPAGAAPDTQAAAGADTVSFIWPSSGALIAGFDEARNKGLDIAGKAGDPVIAAADGRVVYAGAGLRGYGNLIILKHNNTYLTAYAHNQTLLVKEDQNVRRGQKIAEMGSTDADRVKLHFEVRRQGKPVDPARYLPAR